MTEQLHFTIIPVVKGAGPYLKSRHEDLFIFGNSALKCTVKQCNTGNRNRKPKTPVIEGAEPLKLIRSLRIRLNVELQRLVPWKI